MNDGGFRKIERDGEARLGPRAVLVAGYTAEEAGQLSQFLVAVGAAGVAVIRCTREMLDIAVGDALDGGGIGEPAPADKLPRVALLSGLTGVEFHAVLDRYHENGLARPIFATATPTNLTFTVRRLLVDLLNEARAFAGQAGK